MGDAQTIKTAGGEELIVLSRRDYDALLARAGDPAAEDRMTGVMAADHGASGQRGLAEEAWRSIEAGHNPLRVIREARGLSQVELAQRARVSQAYLSKLETRGMAGATAHVLGSLARALEIDAEALESDA